MKYRPLGKSELRVSQQGLGCMGMSEWYGPTNDKESLATLGLAVDSGLNFFDTADVYGNGHNETLVGHALQPVRHEVVLASKFGFLPNESGLNGRPEYVFSACDASLKRLGTDYIDLYYLHRIDPGVPLDETVGAMAELVSRGKVRYLGLSEVSAASLKIANAIHPIAALQTEYSIWVRDIETDILASCRELEVAVIPYSPLGRGFLTGQLKSPEQFGDSDYRKDIPLFQHENFENNLAVVNVLEDIADARHCKPAQVALAWLHAQGADIFPIPGTKRRTYLAENLESMGFNLTDEELGRINEVSLLVRGERKNESGMNLVDNRQAPS